MKKWAMIIDVAKCHDCNNCFLACKDEYYGNDFLPYSAAQPKHGHRWLNILRKERGQYPKVDVAYLPMPCMHCDDPPCIKVSKDGAVYKREDGIVIIDPEKAKGQKDLLKSCPYGAIWWNEEKAIPQKCTLCVHLLEEGWRKPRCVQACPTGAMEIVLMDDSGIDSLKETDSLEPYLPQFKTRPRVLYKNLYKYEKCFVAGSVVFGDIDECAEGAKVILKEGSEAVAEVVTNNYGDFKIDGLNSGEYELEIQSPNYEKELLSIDLKESVNVGSIFLQRTA